MTAVNVILHPSAAYVLTDGAAIADDILVAKMGKVVPLPHINAVITARGPSLVPLALAMQSSRHRHSFDEASERLGGDLRALQDGARGTTYELPADIEAYLIGWSEVSGRPAARVAFNHDVPGLSAFEVAELHGGIAPRTETTDPRLAIINRALCERGGDHTAIDPVSDGLYLMEAQRQVAKAGVGGFCQLTTILPEGITTRILRRWPDAIGEPLGLGT